MIPAMGVYSVKPDDISKLVGWNPEGVGSALAFPYPGVKGFCRIKVFPPYQDNKGRKVKYLQRKGSGIHLYILPPVQGQISNPTMPLYFTEGEKKAAKAVQEGLACIGLGGLWNWIEKTTGEGIDELGRIAWPERKVIIVPDSDIWTRPDLQKAVFAFGKELEKKGAKVLVIVIPQDDDEKLGIDDFLCKHSRAEVESLKKLPLKHPSLKQHLQWWKGWIQKKQIGPAPAVKPAAIELVENVSLIQVHAAQQEITSSPFSGDLLELAIATAVSLRFFGRFGMDPE